MKILVTGANGFVGRALCTHLASQGHIVTPVVRRPCGMAGEKLITDTRDCEAWVELLNRCEGVVHLAARVHVLQDDAVDPWLLYRADNVAATLALAQASVKAGVKRLVFLSSIKVNGEGGDRAYRAEDTPAPEDGYAVSKWEAEQTLHKIAHSTGLEVVIFRPPLVYGPGVGANFYKMMNMIAHGWPLPFGAVRNRRSLLYLGNLCDSIEVSLTHPAASGKTLLPCDAENVSTPILIKRLAQSMGRKSCLIPIPPWLIHIIGVLLGKNHQMNRLLGSLIIDPSGMQRELGWTPPFTMEEGLQKTVIWFQRHKSDHETLS
jgi:nucleoside-diphosphate-sugar epimerase